MTKPKPLPEICRCACGRKAELDWGYYNTTTEQVLCGCGWEGPLRKTARAAILAWNRVMGRDDIGRILLCARILRAIRKHPAGQIDAVYRVIDEVRRGE